MALSLGLVFALGRWLSLCSVVEWVDAGSATYETQTVVFSYLAIPAARMMFRVTSNSFFRNS